MHFIELSEIIDCLPMNAGTRFEFALPLCEQAAWVALYGVQA